MPIGKDAHFLFAIGWRTFGERRIGRRWRLCARSRGHTIVGTADTRAEVWSAVSAMALHLLAPHLREGRERKK